MTDLRYVVYIVGAALLASIGGIIYLAGSSDKPIPDVLQNLAVGSLTGLVGLLVPSSRHRSEGGTSDLSILLGMAGVGLIVLDVFVVTGIALTVIGVLLILAAVALAFLRR